MFLVNYWCCSSIIIILIDYRKQIECSVVKKLSEKKISFLTNSFGIVEKEN